MKNSINILGEEIDPENSPTYSVAVYSGGRLISSSLRMGFSDYRLEDWLAHLEQLIVAMGGKALHGAGKVSHQNALTHAEAEYAKYRSQLAELPSEAEAAYLETVKTVQKKISGKKTP